MTSKQKDLLIKDLCSRLPYGVKVKISSMESSLTVLSINTNGETWVKGDKGYPFEIDWENCKSYLFPLSSMTEEQEKELLKVYSDEAELIAEHLKSDISGNVHTHRFNHQLSLNWYLKNHFDINGLIPMELAEDATGKNIY